MIIDFVGCWVIEVVCKRLFAVLETKEMITRGWERREKRRLEEEEKKRKARQQQQLRVWSALPKWVEWEVGGRAEWAGVRCKVSGWVSGKVGAGGWVRGRVEVGGNGEKRCLR